MPDIGTGVSAGLSLFSASEGIDAADSAQSLDEAALQLEIDRDRFNREIIEESNQFTREDRGDFIGRRDRSRALYDPLQEEMIALAREGPDYDGAVSRADADVAQAYGIARDIEQRRQSRYGINPSSGRAASESRRLGNEEALSKVNARNRAYREEDDKDWARKMAALGTGNIGNAIPNTVLQQLGVSGASGVYQNMARNEGMNAQGAFQLAGSTLADALEGWDNRDRSGGYRSSNYEQYAGTDFEQEYGL